MSKLFFLLSLLVWKVTTTDPVVELINKVIGDTISYSGNYFGFSVAVDGEYTIIGMKYDSSNKGTAIILKKNSDDTWSQTAKLTASDGASGDYFGLSVAISGSRAIIGAPYDDDLGSNSGSAYTFDENSDGTWSQTAKLTASDGAATDLFGHSVAISGSRAIISAMYDDDLGSKSGSAYTFAENSDGTWSQTAKLTASDGASDDYFGLSVAISGSRAIIGAPGDNDLGSASGSAYTFAESSDRTWSQTSKLTASDGASGDQFGRSVAISGSRAIIGAKFDDDLGSNSGSAYTFAENSDRTWSQTSKLTASDGASEDYFGVSVAISGSRAIIGAHGDDDLGSAYTFGENSDRTWSQTSKLTASDGAASDNFGQSVAISNGTAFICAPKDDDLGYDSGSAYYFAEKSNGIWVSNQKVTQKTYDYYGDAVAITQSSTAAIVGAKGDDTSAAYIYTKMNIETNGTNSTNFTKVTNWSSISKLTPTDYTNVFYFGAAVGITQTSTHLAAVVGAPGGENGTAFVFTNSSDNLSQESQLAPNSSKAVEAFGSSVAISGDYILIGAPGFSLTSTGIAFFFKRIITGNEATWNQVTELQPNTNNLYFGGVVALSGNTGIVGAEGSESAYIVEKDENDEWSLTSKLSTSDITTSFGRAVAISNDETLCVIGAPESNCAYVFAKTNDVWSQQSKLSFNSSVEFGFAVAVTDKKIIVSDSEDSVFIFTESSSGVWSQVSNITAPSEVPSDSTFGFALAIAEDTLLIGNRANENVVTDLGSAFFYSVKEISMTVASTTSTLSCASDYDCLEAQYCSYPSRRHRRLRRRHILFAPYTDPGICVDV